VGEKKRILIGTGTTPLAVTRVQPAGKGAMPAADWWRGQRDETLRAGA
jgi:methionyl-tRNA formyltransferase